jgi:hypothetical protein
MAWEIIDLLGKGKKLRQDDVDMKKKNAETMKKIKFFIEKPLKIARDILIQSCFKSSTVIKHIEQDHWEKVLDFKNLDTRMIAVTEWLELVTELSLVKSNMTDIVFGQMINFSPRVIPCCYETEKSMTLRRYIYVFLYI